MIIRKKFDVGTASSLVMSSLFDPLKAEVLKLFSTQTTKIATGFSGLHCGGGKILSEERDKWTEVQYKHFHWIF